MKNTNQFKTEVAVLANTVSIKVFLIGMMGTGKTFWAERLKEKLKVPAYDLDNLIELIDERTVAEIFEQSGEEYFRKEEAKMLRLFAEKKSFILSCGGGTPCFNENMNWMKKQGITIWIDEPVEVIASRLLPEKDKRPLIKDLNPIQLAAFLRNKLAERIPIYQQCQYCLSGVNITEANLVNLIKKHA